jgi:hypothetical protein
MVESAAHLVNHLLFAMAIAIKSNFQRITEPADIASTVGVSFIINHIAALVISVTFGMIWLYSPAIVFLGDAGMAAGSLLLSLLGPDDPREGNEIHQRRLVKDAG